jgi:hypothetical protein
MPCWISAPRPIWMPGWPKMADRSLHPPACETGRSLAWLGGLRGGGFRHGAHRLPKPCSTAPSCQGRQRHPGPDQSYLGANGCLHFFRQPFSQAGPERSGAIHHGPNDAGRPPGGGRAGRPFPDRIPRGDRIHQGLDPARHHHAPQPPAMVFRCPIARAEPAVLPGHPATLTADPQPCNWIIRPGCVCFGFCLLRPFTAMPPARSKR